MFLAVYRLLVLNQIGIPDRLVMTMAECRSFTGTLIC